MALRVLPTALLFLLLCRRLMASRVAVSGNGYGNVVAAIGDDVRQQDQPGLVAAIQSAFADASVYLYGATGRRIFFRNVTIVVPSSWNDGSGTSYGPAIHEIYSTADVRITSMSDLNKMFAVRYLSECGQPGEYIISGRSRFNDDGSTGRALVHEWARYRWGVYDEHPTSPAQVYTYLPEGRYAATKCGAGLNGDVVRRKNGLVCHPTSAGDECGFRSTAGGSNVDSSVMFYQDIDEVTKFCGVDDSAGSVHNSDANNDQNAWCNYRSTWDVIKSHADFQGVQPAQLTAEQIKPIFNVVQAKPYDQIVLVIDVSTSMAQQRRLEKLRQVAYLFINMLPAGTRVGVVAFSSDAQIRLNLTEITDDTSRKIIYDALPDNTVAATSIGSGIKAALDVIRTAGGGKFQAGSGMVLLNDGDETIFPHIDAVAGDLLQSGVRLFTVTIADTGSRSTSLSTFRTLRNLAEQTSGYQFLVPANGNQQLSALLTIFGSVAEMALSHRQRPVHLMQESKTLGVNSDVSSSFLVDSTASERLQIQVALDVSESTQLPFNATVTSPDGTKYDDQLIISSQFRTIHFSIENPKVGQWQVVVSAQSASSITVIIGALAYSSPQGVGPLVVIPKVNGRDVQDNMPSLFSVAVKQGEKALIHAEVSATIVSPGGRMVQWALKDNGADPDYLANDGIYSSYFTDYIGLQRRGQYSIQFSTKSTKNSTLVDPVPYRDTSAFYIRQTDDSNEVTLSPPTLAPTFQRTTSGGMTIFNDFILSGTDVYPPSRITDLHVVSTSYNDSAVTVAWTAPGDDYDQGTVDSYEIRWVRDDQKFLQIQPENGTLLSPTGFRVESTAVHTPRPAGKTETLTLRLPDKVNKTYYFTIRGVDDSGWRTPFSPVLGVTLLPYVPLPKGEGSDGGGGISKGAIAGIAVGSALSFLLASIFLVVYLKRRAGKGSDGSANDSEKAKLEESSSWHSGSPHSSEGGPRGRQKRRQKKSLTANEEVLSLENAGSIISVETNMTFVSQNPTEHQQLTPDQKSRMEVINEPSPMSSNSDSEQEEEEKGAGEVDKEIGESEGSKEDEDDEYTVPEKDPAFATEEKEVPEVEDDDENEEEEDLDDGEDRQMMY